MDTLAITPSLSWPANAGHPDDTDTSVDILACFTWMAHTPVGHDTWGC